MKQETKPLTKEVIDWFRYFHDKEFCGNGCSECEGRRSILAVLEAAYEVKRAWSPLTDASPAEIWVARDDRITKRDALLALIDLSDDLRVLGGTK